MNPGLPSERLGAMLSQAQGEVVARATASMSNDEWRLLGCTSGYAGFVHRLSGRRGVPGCGFVGRRARGAALTGRRRRHIPARPPSAATSPGISSRSPPVHSATSASKPPSSLVAEAGPYSTTSSSLIFVSVSASASTRPKRLTLVRALLGGQLAQADECRQQVCPSERQTTGGRYAALPACHF